MTAPAGACDPAGRGQPGGVGVHPVGELGVVAQHAQGGQGGAGRCRGQRRVVDEGAGGVDEVLAHHGRPRAPHRPVPQGTSRGWPSRRRARSARGRRRRPGHHRGGRRPPGRAPRRRRGWRRPRRSARRGRRSARRRRAPSRSTPPRPRPAGASRRESSSATCSRSLCRATVTAARDSRQPSIRLAWACSSLTTSVPASARVVSTARLAAYPLDRASAAGAPVSAARAASSWSCTSRVPVTSREAPAPPP